MKSPDFIENDDELKRLREKNRKWEENFNKVIQIYELAKQKEKTEPLTAIEIYQSIRDTNYGDFDVLGRLIILYRKTKQTSEELKHIEFKIEHIHNSEYNRMQFLSLKYPEDADLIRNCYDNELIYVTPEGYDIDFYKEIRKLVLRKDKLLKNISK